MVRTLFTSQQTSADHGARADRRVLLMFLGIGFVAMLTATVAARFVEGGDSALAAEIQRVHERLDEVQQLLERLSGNQNH